MSYRNNLYSQQSTLTLPWKMKPLSESREEAGAGEAAGSWKLQLAHVTILYPPPSLALAPGTRTLETQVKIEI